MTPATDTTSPDIAVVGALDRFVVVWVDQHKPATTEIWIAAVDPNTATASIAKQASLDDPAKKKFFPRVVYDVSSDTVAVAWIEMDLATTNFNVMFTRYSRDLQTRLPTAPMSVNAGTLQAKQVAIGFAVGKQNEYGLAYRSLDNRAYFSKVNCQGP
jgi:hypothetical protein